MQELEGKILGRVDKELSPTVDVAIVGFADGIPIKVDVNCPHVIFYCGMRGSGKSWSMAVLIEELIENGKCGVIIDPSGIFWGLKYPNPEQMNGKGYLDNIQVLITPSEAETVEKSFYDGILRFPISEITGEDFTSLFGLEETDRTSIEFAKLKSSLDDETRRTKKGYDIADLIRVVEESKIMPKVKNALVVRLTKMEESGLFGKEGLTVTDLVKLGQFTVIDLAGISDNIWRNFIANYVVQKIFQARKQSKKTERDIIPSCWICIDGAHLFDHLSTLHNAVREGSTPGVGVVIATQQLSAIDPKIISQVDIMFIHRLVFADDVATAIKWCPSEMPQVHQDMLRYQLKSGQVIVGDAEELEKTIVGEIKGRRTLHAGTHLKVLPPKKEGI